MRSTLPFVAVAGSMLLVMASAMPGSPARSLLPSAATPRSPAAEVTRIRAHFDSVLAVLPGRDVSGLSVAQREQRSLLLARLADYRDRGEFPRNYDFPAQATPYFVDRETGVLCAVAHLIATTGRSDIVRRVADANNNVRVMALAGDTAFTGWLDRSGLTLAEAAWIQVPYVFPDPSLEPPAPTRLSNSLNAGSAVAMGGALLASYWNARHDGAGAGQRSSLLGFTAGAAAMGLGAATLSEPGGSPGIGAATAVVGVASVYFATRGIFRSRSARAQREMASREAPRASIAPIIPVDGVSGAGASVTLRF